MSLSVSGGHVSICLCPPSAAICLCPSPAVTCHTRFPEFTFLVVWGPKSGHNDRETSLVLVFLSKTVSKLQFS